MQARSVEVLFLSGCPNYRATYDLVRRVADELNVHADIDLVEVPDAEGAEGLRFLGSPSVRVGGIDVEPGAADRSDYAFACRVYRGPSGVAAMPDESWIRDALRETHGS